AATGAGDCGGERRPFEFAISLVPCVLCFGGGAESLRWSGDPLQSIACHTGTVRAYGDTFSDWERHFPDDAERSGMAAAAARRTVVAGRGADLSVVHSSGAHFVLMRMQFELDSSQRMNISMPRLPVV